MVQNKPSWMSPSLFFTRVGVGLPSLTGFKTDEFLVLCLSVLYLIINFMTSLEQISVDIYYISNKIEVFSMSTVYF